jgi:multidrug efflux pump subunit AcrA (membrane-fusion protein)
MKSFLQKHKNKIIWALLSALLVWGIMAIRKSNTPVSKTETVKKGDIKETVKITGTVKSQNDASLSLEKSGLVNAVYKKEGDTVVAGETILSLSTGDVYGQVLEARANLDNQRAILDGLLTGARTEELAIKESGVNGANVELKNTYNQTIESIKNAYSSSVDIVLLKLKDTVSGNSVNGYTVNLKSCNSSLENEAAVSRREIENTLNSWQILVNNQNAEDASLVERNLNTSLSYASQIRDYTNKLNTLATASCVSSDTQTTANQNAITLSKTAINATILDLTTKVNQIASIKSNIDKAGKDLNLTTAGFGSDKIAGQRAQVRAAEARLIQVQASLSKNYLRSPISGIITSIDIEKGELAQTGKTLVRVISEGAFIVEGKVTEADVAKLSIGNNSLIKIEALDSDLTLNGVLTTIDQAENTSDSSPLYSIKISISDKNEKIKSGMSAETIIVTGEKKDVLVIPMKFVTKKDGKNYVTLEEKEISLGKKSTDGLIEIVAGLNAGDIVAVENKTETTK